MGDGKARRLEVVFRSLGSRARRGGVETFAEASLDEAALAPEAVSEGEHCSADHRRGDAQDLRGLLRALAERRDRRNRNGEYEYAHDNPRQRRDEDPASDSRARTRWLDERQEPRSVDEQVVAVLRLKKTVLMRVAQPPAYDPSTPERLEIRHPIRCRKLADTRSCGIGGQRRVDDQSSTEEHAR